jgi:hypothetical protein
VVLGVMVPALLVFLVWQVLAWREQRRLSSFSGTDH